MDGRTRTTTMTTDGEWSQKLTLSFQLRWANKEWNRYALLEADEVHACSNVVMRYCTPRNAVLLVNLHRHCALALFFKENAEVDTYCRKIVTPNAMLPQAKYLSVGQWVVALREPLTFSVVCTENRDERSATTQQTKTMKPPLDVIKLKPGCSGSSNLLNLPPYYQFEDYATVKDPFSNLIELRNKSKFRIWDHLEEALWLIWSGNLETCVRSKLKTNRGQCGFT